MARSSIIYVVVDTDGPIAAFTVKHELRTWLEQNGDGDLENKDWVVWRVGDGIDGERPLRLGDAQSAFDKLSGGSS